MSIASDPKHCPKCQTPLPGDAPQGLCPKCLLAAASVPTDVGQPAPDKTPPSVAELAAAFPQLEILELIGQGGMGFVFKARQPKLDRFVALKILPQSLAADPAFAERFNREGRVLAKLNHPNIVTIHDFGITTGRADLPVRQDNEAAQQHRPTPQFYYLLMEFVDGVNLRQAMRAGRFTPDQALAIVPKICEALQFAHNEGILHRDIKPENILLDAKGRVKIADFGIAKLVAAVCDRRDSVKDDLRRSQTAATENLTEAGKALGTPNYMAPEQRECSGEVDHRADIYSLGVVFYEMLTGELPLGRFAPPSQKSTADPRVDEVVLRALEKEKAKRYASADEVKTQVETIAATPDSGRRRGDESQTEKQSADKDKSQSLLTSSPTGVEPRFSPTAIVGAAWVTLFFLVAIGPLRWNYGGQVWLKTLMFLPCLLGLSAILGTTILGWIAVSQIRRSAGKLHGLWLAVFDGLLFPLLAMNVVVIGGSIFALRLILGSGAPVKFFLLLLLLLAGLGLLAILITTNVFMIRAVWRAVNKPLAESGASVPPAKLARKNSTGKIIAIGCGVLAAVGLIILLLMVLFMYLSYARLPSSARLKEQQNVPAKAAFGPVVERVIADIRQNPTQACLDFRTGEWRYPQDTNLQNRVRLMTGSRHDLQAPGDALNDWIKDSGVDLICYQSSDGGMEFKFFGEPPGYTSENPSRFDTISPEEVMQTLNAITAHAEPVSKLTDIRVQTIDLAHDDSTRILFRTHDGDAGVLEILGASRDPRGVKLRYKLVQSAGNIAVPASGFIRQSGTYQLAGNGGVLALTPSTGGRVSFALTRVWGTGRETDSIPDFFKQDGWFVYVESAERIWIFDGIRQLDVVAPNGRYSAGDLGVRALCPQAVWDAVPESARKFYRETQNSEDSHAVGKPQNLSFGPVVERVVNLESPGTNSALDLDSGRFVSLAPIALLLNATIEDEHAGEMCDQFMKKNGVDVIGRTTMSWTSMSLTSTNSHNVTLNGLFCSYGTLAYEVISSEWDEADAKKVTDFYIPKAFENRFISGVGDLPKTYIVKTRAGGMGILQITGFTDNPRGVKIRYKLVQNAVMDAEKKLHDQRPQGNAGSSAKLNPSETTIALKALAPMPSANDLPGTLTFHGHYKHRSRGVDIEQPSELWLKETPDGSVTALAQLPFSNSTEMADGKQHRIGQSASGNRPGYQIDLEIGNGQARLNRRGIRQDCDGKELKVPAGAWFDPNTRPDSYCAANVLLRAFAVGENETKEFRAYDWGNTGEALVDYTIRIKHAGKERVEVPAGTFEANHLVLTQLTSANTWFKKTAGHVTDFWVLDNHVIVRVLRHREPYEVILLDYSVPEKLPGLVKPAS